MNTALWYKFLPTILALIVPVLSSAQPTSNFGGIGTTVGSVIAFIDGYLIPLVFAVSLLMFFWGLYRYIFWQSEEGRENASSLMMWGVIGFVIMVSVWGLVNVIAGGLGFNTDVAPTLPVIPTIGR